MKLLHRVQDSGCRRGVHRRPWIYHRECTGDGETL